MNPADLKLLHHVWRPRASISNRKAVLESYACWCPLASGGRGGASCYLINGELRKRVKAAFQEAGIEIPFTERVIYSESSPAEKKPDRPYKT